MELRVDGLKIGHRMWGSPDNPALVLMHSTSFGAWMWEPVALLLRDHFYVIATDQPGHGDSDPAAEGEWQFPRFAEYLYEALQQVGVERPLAVGHSSGSTTLTLCESAHPGTFTKLMLIEPIIPPGTNPFPEGSNPMAEGARRRRPGFDSPEAMIAAFRDRAPFNSWSAEALRLYAKEGTKRSADGVALKCLPEHEARFYEAVFGFDPEVFRRVGCPVMLVEGERSDGMRAGMFERARELLPDATVTTVPGAGHFIPQEQPLSVAKMIREFAAGG